MTTDRDLARTVRSWLRTPEHESADRVLGAVLGLLDTTPQRRSSWPARRFAQMSTYAKIAAAAAVIVLAVIGFSMLPRTNGVAGPPATASPSPPQLTGQVPPATLSPSPTTSPPSSMPSMALTSSFTSRRYGYTIAIDPAWTTTPATKTWVGYDNSPPFVDQIGVAGTDTTIQGSSQPLAKGQTYDEWLALYEALTVKSVPPGCNGGDPSTWPMVTVGGLQGRWQQACNAATAVVLVGDRVYAFNWSNAAFLPTHLSIDDFKRVLATVTFQPVQ
jgi:hypothetical protein